MILLHILFQYKSEKTLRETSLEAIGIMNGRAALRYENDQDLQYQIIIVESPLNLRPLSSLLIVFRESNFSF